MSIERNTLLKYLALGIVALGLAFGYFKYRDNALANLGSKDPRVGSEAPDFTLRKFAGPTASLSDFRGDLVLLDFWSTTCGPCERQMPHLKSLESEFADDGFRVVSINTDPPQRSRNRNVGHYLEHWDLEFDVLLDDGRAQAAYDVTRIPTMVLVDRDGRFARVYNGFTQRGVLRQGIRAHL